MADEHSTSKFYTYVHRKADNGEVFYVGKGCRGRAYDKNNRNKHWNNFVSKHGFKVEIVSVFDDEEDAFEHERSLIAEYRNCGVNLANYTDGGEGQSGVSPSAEHRAKLSAALKGRKWTEAQRIAYEKSERVKHHGTVISPEHRKKMNEARRMNFDSGKLTVWNAGKKLSDSHRENIKRALQCHFSRGFPVSSDTKTKISQHGRGAGSGKPLSKEHIAKLSAAASGKVMSPETRAKMSIAKRAMTEDTKRKMSESQKARWAAKVSAQI